MATSANINDILSQVEQLDKKEQFALLQRLHSLLKKPEQAQDSARLTSLSGLGSEIWKSKESIDQYLDEERQW